MKIEKMIQELDVAFTFSDREGKILYMNDKASITFEKYGGESLIGKNLLECHPEPSRSKLEGMLQAAEPNCYTVEKKGVKKLIYQGPWQEEGHYMGFVEISIVMPDNLPHHVRK
jgi:PAS domain S-box-containing protein